MEVYDRHWRKEKTINGGEELRSNNGDYLEDNWMTSKLMCYRWMGGAQRIERYLDHVQNDVETNKGVTHYEEILKLGSV